MRARRCRLDLIEHSNMFQKFNEFGSLVCVAWLPKKKRNEEKTIRKCDVLTKGL